MSGELPMISCPECDATFCVVWNRSYEGEHPEFCPMCGAEIDYAKLGTQEEEAE